MTKEQIQAELDKLLIEYARACEVVARIDGAIQTFKYIQTLEAPAPAPAPEVTQ